MSELTLEALAAGEPITADQVQKNDLLRIVTCSKTDLRTYVEITESVAHHRHEANGDWSDQRGNWLTRTGNDNAATFLIRRSPLNVLPSTARSTIFYVQLREEDRPYFDELTLDNQGVWHGVDHSGDYRAVSPEEIRSFHRDRTDFEDEAIVVGDIPAS